MGQTQAAKNRQLGIVMLVSAFVLGFGLFALSILSKNEHMNTRTLVVKEPEIIKTDNKEDKQPIVEISDEELSNQIIEQLDKDIGEMEIQTEDLTDLE